MGEAKKQVQHHQKRQAIPACSKLTVTTQGLDEKYENSTIQILVRAHVHNYDGNPPRCTICGAEQPINTEDINGDPNNSGG